MRTYDHIGICTIVLILSWGNPWILDDPEFPQGHHCLHLIHQGNARKKQWGLFHGFREVAQVPQVVLRSGHLFVVNLPMVSSNWRMASCQFLVHQCKSQNIRKTGSKDFKGLEIDTCTVLSRDLGPRSQTFSSQTRASISWLRVDYRQFPSFIASQLSSLMILIHPNVGMVDCWVDLPEMSSIAGKEPCSTQQASKQHVQPRRPWIDQLNDPGSSYRTLICSETETALHPMNGLNMDVKNRTLYIKISGKVLTYNTVPQWKSFCQTLRVFPWLDWTPQSLHGIPQDGRDENPLPWTPCGRKPRICQTLAAGQASPADQCIAQSDQL